MLRSRTLAAAMAVACVAYAVRLAYLYQISRSPFFDFMQLDPLYYLEWARRIAAGDWLGGADVFEMSPLYSYLLAIYLSIAGEDLWLLRLLQIGVGSGTCVLTMLLGSRLFDARTGLLAGLGCALYAPFLFYEGQVMKEFLTPPLATAALLMVLRSAERTPADPAGGPLGWAARGWLAAAGALIALAALVRDNFLVLLATLAVWALWASRGPRPAGAAARLAPPAALLAGALLVLLPVGLRNLAVGGDFVLTTAGGGEVFYIGNGPYANGAYVPPPWVRSNPRFEHEDFRRKAREMTGRELSRAEASRHWWQQGLSWIAANPGPAALLWLRKFALFWNDHELPDNYSFYTFTQFSWILAGLLRFGPIAALAWAGMALTAFQWRRLLPVHLAAAGYMLSVMIFFNFARFRLPVVPILLVFAARAVTWGYDTLRASAPLPRSHRRLAALAGALLVAGPPFCYIDWSTPAEEPFQDRLHMGAAFRQSGKPQEAEKVLRKAIEEAEALVRSRGGDPTRPASTPGGVTFVMALSAAHRDLAGALSDQKRATEAAAEYALAASLNPTDAALQLSLASALKATGDVAGAEKACRRATTIDPSSFAAWFDLATLLYEQGRLDEAMAAMQRGRAARPQLAPLDMADYHFGVGAILYARPGREAEAAEHFREGLRLNPSAPGAEGAREALRQMELTRPKAPARP